VNLFVSAIPRSGTNYVTYVLFFLHSLLVKKFDGRGVDAPYPLPPIVEYRHLHMEILAVAHASLDEQYMTCPDDTARDKWRALDFYHRLYNDFKFERDEDDGVRDFIDQRGSVELADPTTKHVFLYRNILDQMVSFYFHLQNHFRADSRGYTDATGVFREFTGIQDFLRNGAVESYLKYYLSYIWAAPQYRDRIMFLTYEDLMAAPKDAFFELLKFADASLDLGVMDEAMDMAIQYSAPENLKSLELDQGKTLANDQKTTQGNTHIRDGGTGVWKKHLDQDDLDFVEQKLNGFGFSLSNFHIEP
jgi:hypothetical protein